MSKLILVFIALATTADLAFAGSAVPGPLLGAVAGPWGLVASVLGYGAYRFYKGTK